MLQITQLHRTTAVPYSLLRSAVLAGSTPLHHHIIQLLAVKDDWEEVDLTLRLCLSLLQDTQTQQPVLRFPTCLYDITGAGQVMSLNRPLGLPQTVPSVAVTLWLTCKAPTSKQCVLCTAHANQPCVP